MGLSSNHSMVPRTMTPKGTTAPCWTTAMGISLYTGLARSFFKSVGFAEVETVKFLREVKAFPQPVFRRHSFQAATHVEGQTPKQRGRQLGPRPAIQTGVDVLGV